MTRKVLLVTYHFPPSGAVAVYRMLGLVRHLPKYGWQPIVVAPPPVPWEPEDASLLDHVPPGTPVERVPFASGFSGKVIRYFAPEAHWFYMARPACRRLIQEHRPEAILTSSPPGCVHRFGLWAQSEFGLPWIACFRDPMSTNRKITNWTLFDRYERRLERKVMKHATALIANTPLNQQGWADAFPESASKIVTIPNGFDPERFPVPIAAAPNTGTLTMLYAGELYWGRDPRPLLEALAELQGDRFPVKLEFLGRATDPVYDVPNEIHRRGLDDVVRQCPQQPYAYAIDRMMNVDINVIIHTPGQLIGVQAKLYEYLGAGRPILALAEPNSDIAWVLRESKVLHRIAAPADVPQIKKALVELTRAVQAGEPAVPDHAALLQFTRERMAQRVAECLDHCVRPHQPSAVSTVLS